MVTLHRELYPFAVNKKKKERDWWRGERIMRTIKYGYDDRKKNKIIQKLKWPQTLNAINIFFCFNFLFG